MRAVVQRVKASKVTVDERVVGAIDRGLLILLGVHRDDTEADAEALADKVAKVRVFDGEDGRMRHSVLDVEGGALVVSQFTLYGDCKKGRRPNFSAAAPASEAEGLYRAFIEALKRRGVPTAEGQFGAMMDVQLINDGPVTLLIESPSSR